MLNTKTLTKLVLITVICAIPVVTLVMKTGVSAIKNKHEVLLPDLLKNPEQVFRVIIQDRENVLTMQRNNNVWEIVEKNNFPVLHDKVEELLFALSDLRVVEPKTANPALYAQLDVNEVTEPESKAILVTVQDYQNQDLAKVLIGKREGLSMGEEYIEHIFVRKAADTQTWLVQGLLPISNDFKDWVEQPLLGLVEADQLKRLVINKPSGDKVIITKVAQEQEDFTLETMQARPDMILDIDSVNTLPFEMANLEFYDVSLAANQNLDWNNSVVAELETFPGLKLDLSVIKQDDVVYGKIHASVPEDASDSLKQQIEKYNLSKNQWYYRLSPEIYKSMNVANVDFLKSSEVTP